MASLKPILLAWAAATALNGIAQTGATMPKPPATMFAPMRQAIEQATARAESAEGSERAAAFGRLGLLYQAHGLYPAAATAYLEATAIQPESPRWAYLLGLTLERLGKPEQAGSFYQALANRHPDDSQALIKSGQIAMLLNRPSEAKIAYLKAIGDRPDNASVHLGLGKLAALEGRHASAVGHFERALELQPHATEIHYPLAMSLRHLGRNQEARTHFGKRGDIAIRAQDARHLELESILPLAAQTYATQLANNDAKFTAPELNNYLVFHLAGRAGMLPFFEAAIASKTAKPEGQQATLAGLHYIAGIILQTSQEPIPALAHFQRAMELIPGFAAAALELGAGYRAAGNFEQAQIFLTRALTIDPNNARALLERSNALMALQRFEKAARDLEQLLSVTPEHGPALLARARLSTLSGAPEKALSDLKRALVIMSSEPQKAEVLAESGRAHHQLGKLEIAVADYQASLKLQPDRAEVHFNLAALLGQMDRFEDSAIHYAATAALEPQNEGAYRGQYTALILGKKWRPAAKVLQAATEAIPESAAITHLLARFLAVAPEAELRDGPRALILAQSNFEKEQSFASAETYAMALAEAGRYEEASQMQRSLIAAAKKAKADQAVTQLVADQNLYQRGQPCCANQSPAILLPRLR